MFSLTLTVAKSSLSSPHRHCLRSGAIILTGTWLLPYVVSQRPRCAPTTLSLPPIKNFSWGITFLLELAQCPLFTIPEQWNPVLCKFLSLCFIKSHCNYLFLCLFPLNGIRAFESRYCHVQFLSTRRASAFAHTHDAQLMFVRLSTAELRGEIWLTRFVVTWNN